MRDFFYHSNFLIAGVAVCFVSGTSALMGLEVGWPLLLLVGCGTFLVYQVDRERPWSSEDKANNPDRIAWIKAHPVLVHSSTVLAFGLAGLALYHLPYPIWSWSALLGGLAVLQIAPVLPGSRRLKDWGRLKPFWLSAVWGLGAVGCVVVRSGQTITWGIVGLILYRMMLVLPNALLSDWPDREGDQAQGLLTWAHQLQEKTLVLWGKGVLGITILFGIGALWLWEAPWLLGVDLIGYIVLYFMIRQPIPEARGYFVCLDVALAWPLITWLISSLA